MKTFICIACFILALLPSFAFATVALPNIPATQFPITSYGASHSSTDNATAIIAAITAANAAGGGTVVIPADTFLSGPFLMKSNVNLYISAGGMLRMLPYGNGNGQPTGSYPNNGTVDAYGVFIGGTSLHNFEISGQGRIEGDGAAWWAAYNANHAIGRPGMIRFSNCDTVLITGITLQNAPNVHLTMGASGAGANGTVSGITVLSPATSPNTDAIDVWYWNGLNILNCNLSEGDDNVALNNYSQNITVKHCTFGNGHGMSVGSYTSHVANVLVDSCTFNGTSNGIRLKTSNTRGGNDSNFMYSNLTMNNVSTPFYITMWYPTEPYPASAQVPGVVTATTPIWKNIYFRNIVVNNSSNAGIIYGLPESHISNVVFDSVHITATTKGMITNFVDGLSFNCSSITLPGGKGHAIIPYTAAISGIDTTTGASTLCNPAPVPTSVGFVKNADQFSCFPNPANGDDLTITGNARIERVRIYNFQGKLVAEQKGGLFNKMRINIKNFPAGSYFANVISDQGTITVLRFLKD